MKNFLLIFFFLFSFSFVAHSQHMEVGVMVGGSIYQGDISPSSVLTSFGQTHAGFGGFARYNVNRFAAARFSVNYLTISGDDSASKDQWRKDRNLSFRSNVLEFGLIGEFNILGYQPYNLEEIFSPYLFAGIALYKFNPRSKYNDDWVDLQPLGTEGQGLAQYPDKKEYNLTQFSIPFGVGVKFALNDSWNIGAELGMRKTFTDYLDDVSTSYVPDAELLEVRGEVAVSLANRTGEPILTEVGRGDSEDLDWYIFAGVTVSYNFMDNGLVGFRRKSGKKSGCPTF